MVNGRSGRAAAKIFFQIIFEGCEGLSRPAVIEQLSEHCSISLRLVDQARFASLQPAKSVVDFDNGWRLAQSAEGGETKMILEEIKGRLFEVEACHGSEVQFRDGERFRDAFVEAMCAAPTETIERLHDLLNGNKNEVPRAASAIMSAFDQSADASLEDEWPFGKPSASVMVAVSAVT